MHPRYLAACVCVALSVLVLAAPSQEESDREAIRVFQQWIDEADLKLNKMEVAVIPGMRMGTIATTNLKEGQHYIAVPSKLFIGPDTAGTNTPLGKELQKLAKNFGPDPMHNTIFFVMQERFNPNSFWRPWFGVIPEEFSTPFYFSDDEMEELRGSTLYQETIEDRQRLREKWEMLDRKVFSQNRKVFNKKTFSFDNYAWATALYNSRVIQLDMGNRGRVPTFIPHVDMVNSIESHDTTFIKYNPRTDTADMYADRDTKLGEQIFESYGNKSQSEYLRFNGFVMEDNPNDCVRITLPPPADANRMRKMQEARMPRLPWTVCCKSDPNPAVVRYFMIMGQKFTQEFFKSLLNGYKSHSVAADKERLKDKSLTDNRRYAIMLVMEEKKTLKALQKYFRNRFK